MQLLQAGAQNKVGKRSIMAGDLGEIQVTAGVEPVLQVLKVRIGIPLVRSEVLFRLKATRQVTSGLRGA